MRWPFALASTVEDLKKAREWHREDSMQATHGWAECRVRRGHAIRERDELQDRLDELQRELNELHNATNLSAAKQCVAESLTYDRIGVCVGSHMRAWEGWDVWGSKKRLAEIIGVASSSVSSMGKGNEHPNMLTCYRLAAFLGLSVEQLITTEAGK